MYNKINNKLILNIHYIYKMREYSKKTLVQERKKYLSFNDE